MPTNFKTPGVYIEEISNFPPSVVPVATAIPAFIGYTEKAKRDPNSATDDLRNKPTRITSLQEYEFWFGGPVQQGGISVVLTEDRIKPDPAGTETVRVSISALASVANPSPYILYPAMRLYFDNGGGPCYIVSVGDYSDTVDHEDLVDGVKTLENYDEPTLIVVPEAFGLADEVKCAAVHQAALAQSAKLQDRISVMDAWIDPSLNLEDPSRLDSLIIGDAKGDVDKFRTAIGQENLKYGTAYFPSVRTNFNYEIDESEVTLTHNLTVDGTANTTDNNFDGVKLDAVVGASGQNNDVYNLALQAINDLFIVLPPSAGMVGRYAFVDNTRGVWKAPANISLASVREPMLVLTDADQEDLNVHPTGKSVNVIRQFQGKGPIVWGARTLDGNDNEWRYVPVRRFFNFAEESIKKATEAFVFEPNDANTWAKVRSMIENFLTIQWRDGALAGAKPEDAFFVRVGLPVTMTSLDILEGRMNVEIGMAVVRPAEFIVLKFSHKMQVS